MKDWYKVKECRKTTIEGNRYRCKEWRRYIREQIQFSTAKACHRYVKNQKMLTCDWKPDRPRMPWTINNTRKQRSICATSTRQLAIGTSWNMLPYWQQMRKQFLEQWSACERNTVTEIERTKAQQWGKTRNHSQQEIKTGYERKPESPYEALELRPKSFSWHSRSHHGPSLTRPSWSIIAHIGTQAT